MDYRAARYLEGVGIDRIQRRAASLVGNLLVLTTDGKMGLRSMDEVSKSLGMRWAHLLEEIEIRRPGFPHLNPANAVLDFLRCERGVPRSPIWDLAPADFPPFDVRSRRCLSAAMTVRELPATEGALYKYGKSEFLRKLLEQGELRICAASSYSDRSLNRAVRDDELVLRSKLHPSLVDMSVVDKAKGLRADIELSEPLTMIHEADTDYFVCCFSTSWAARLFVDFSADACLVIRRPRVFLDRVRRGVESLHPAASYGESVVTYVDPLFESAVDTDVFLGKHFKYLYQDEFRCVWKPKQKTKRLEPIHLRLGDQTDVAHLVSLRR